MKSLFKIFAIASLLLFGNLLSAQTKDAYFTPKIANANLFVTADIAGKTFKSQQVLAKNTLKNGKKGYVIIAVSETGRIEMKLEKELKAGTFAINSTDKKSMMMYAPKGKMPYVTSKCKDATGSLTISEISEHSMSGTFSFTVKYMVANCDSAEKITITNGKFKVNF